MVRANGQRDGVGKTSQLSGAFEHTGAILDPTRVSPYRPAAVDMPQSMRPDTRQHLTACPGPSERRMTAWKRRHRARPTAAVKPLRGSSAPLRPLRVTAAANRAGTLLRGQPGGWPSFNGSTRRRLRSKSTERRTNRFRKGLQFQEASTHDSCRAGFAPAEEQRLLTAHRTARAIGTPGSATSCTSTWPTARFRSVAC